MDALDEVQWRAPEWIQAYGLRTDNVLEYFSLSPFYDRSSNNQVLKMQSNFNDQLQGRDLSKELLGMRGLEFVLAFSHEPDLWVIRRQHRKSPTEADILATYFVVGENIYQAPSVYGVVSSRLLATSLNLGEALDVAQALPKFTSAGYTYDEEAAPPSDEGSQDFDRALAVSMGRAHFLPSG